MTKRAVSIFVMFLLVAVLVCSAALHGGDPHRVTLWTLYSDELSFAVNVVPDIVSNTTVLFFNSAFSMLRGEEVSNIWPIVTATSPVTGPLCGIRDARHGYPFWNPVALDEKRQYEYYGNQGCSGCTGQTCTIKSE